MLNRIRQLLRSMDDDALAALANKGLLRRAKKDLESTTPTILETSEKHVRLQVEDCVVTIPEIPANARSTSPAGAIDRYVLIAFLWLREQDEANETSSDNVTPSAAAASTPGPESFDDETLIRWAGKTLFQKTLRLLNAGFRCVVDNPNPLVFRVPQRNITCRWINGGNLETMLVSSPASNPVADGLLAVLLYQIECGKRGIPTETALPLEASSGTPRTREEVLHSLESVLCEMLTLGLVRLSEATVLRLQTLAVSAHGVDLPRLERMIHTLADDIKLQLKRDAQAAVSRLLASASRIDALRRALRNRLFGQAAGNDLTPLADLVGEHRSRYHAVGDIELIGMGARQWQTKSGYTGLTVYFWDQSTANWASWSASRPLSQPGFDPASVYRSEGPWVGCTSPEFASKNRIKLVGAFRNDHGRLSASKATKAIPLPIKEIDPALPPTPIMDWNVLQGQSQRLFAGGVARHSEQQEIVFFKPTRWKEPNYDTINQRLIRPVIDHNDTVIPLVLVNEKSKAIDILEHYAPTDCLGVLGLLRLLPDGICVEPVALFQREGIRNLTLEGFHGSMKKVLDSPQDEESNDPPEEEIPVESFTRIGNLLQQVQTELQWIAESGLGVHRDDAALAQLVDKMKTIGLMVCASPVERFLEQRRQSRQSLDQAANLPAAVSLLESYYVILLAMKQESFHNTKRSAVP